MIAVDSHTSVPAQPSAFDLDGGVFGQELSSIDMPWQPFAVASRHQQMAVGSFIQERQNFIHLYDVSSSELSRIAELRHDFPPCQLAWSSEGMLAACSQTISVYRPAAVDGMLSPTPVQLCNGTAPSATASITAIDWNPVEPHLLAASSVDTTCTVWQVETAQIKTQLIAHDKQVFDICFASSPHLFATVGGDGSVRIFDLRHLEHSTILYEESHALLRVAWNRLDPHYLLTFGIYSHNVILLDTRVPSVPVAELEGHSGLVNDICWSPSHASLCASGADDGQLLVWDISGQTAPEQAGGDGWCGRGTARRGLYRKHTSSSEVQQLAWSHDGSVIGISERSSVSLVAFSLENGSTN